VPTARDRGDSRDRARPSWDDADSNDEEYPPWAGPTVTPRRAGGERGSRRADGPQGHGERDSRGERGGRGEHSGRGEHGERGGRGDDRRRAGPRRARGQAGPAREPADTSPGFRSRQAAARSKRRSLFIWVWAGAAAAVALIVTGVVLMLGGNPSVAKNPGFVTSFQRGEIKTVPNACTAVTGATLGQYLPGTRRMVAPHSLDGTMQSLCNWTLDAPPMYRVLEATVQAYAPSGLATGTGSATFAAIDAYQQALGSIRHPARATHLPGATVIALHGLGTAAFAALQVVHLRGDVTDLETVVARDRNVLVTVVLQGPHARNGKYSAAPQSMLQSGAIAAAKDIVTRLH
jgi:hypothetical protein